MEEGYKTIGIPVRLHRKLKEIAKENKTTLIGAIEMLIENYENDRNSLTVEIERIVREVVDEAVQKIISSVRQRKSGIDLIKDAFLGLREPISLKDGFVVVSKAQIFVRTDKIKIDVGKFEAKVFEETDEEGNVIGVSVVPNVGFGGSLERWAEKHLKELLTEIIKSKG